MDNPLPKNIQPAFPRETAGDDVRARLIELLGLDEAPEQVEVTEGGTKSEDGISSTRVSYSNSLGETLSAVILTPESAERDIPGVVCMHGTGGNVDNVVADELRLEHAAGGQLLGWGRELTRRGYGTISISLKGSVVRRGTVERWEEEAKLLEAYGRPHVGIVVEETLRAARVLAEHPAVDGERIALAGMSLGGLATWYTMACAPWIHTGAAICGVLGSLARLIHEGNVDRHSSMIFIPHLLRYFDHADIIASCIPPRPFMAVGPTEDVDMPRSGVDEMIASASRSYAALGVPEHFKVYQPPGDHVFQIQYFEWMLDWFDRFLRRP